MRLSTINANSGMKTTIQEINTPQTSILYHMETFDNVRIRNPSPVKSEKKIPPRRVITSIINTWQRLIWRSLTRCGPLSY